MYCFNSGIFTSDMLGLSFGTFEFVRSDPDLVAFEI